jgi:hypothetical protein
MKFVNIISIVICFFALIIFIDYRAPKDTRINELPDNNQLYDKLLPLVYKDIYSNIIHPYDYILTDIKFSEIDSTYLIQFVHLNFIRGKNINKVGKCFYNFKFDNKFKLISMPDTTLCLL